MMANYDDIDYDRHRSLFWLVQNTLRTNLFIHIICYDDVGNLNVLYRSYIYIL